MSLLRFLVLCGLVCLVVASKKSKPSASATPETAKTAAPESDLKPADTIGLGFYAYPAPIGYHYGYGYPYAGYRYYGYKYPFFGYKAHLFHPWAYYG